MSCFDWENLRELVYTTLHSKHDDTSPSVYVLNAESVHACTQCMQARMHASYSQPRVPQKLLCLRGSTNDDTPVEF